MATLVLIAGLPGSGKSRLIDEIVTTTSKIGLIAPDFMKASINDSPRIKDSRHFAGMLADLEAGHDCIIADIEFCRQSKREELEQALVASGVQAALRWIFFANDPAACKRNATTRNRESLSEELATIDTLSAVYTIPPDAETRPVWKPTGT